MCDEWKSVPAAKMKATAAQKTEYDDNDDENE
jgi:hypothetical protein